MSKPASSYSTEGGATEEVLTEVARGGKVVGKSGAISCMVGATKLSSRICGDEFASWFKSFVSKIYELVTAYAR